MTAQNLGDVNVNSIFLQNLAFWSTGAPAGKRLWLSSPYTGTASLGISTNVVRASPLFLAQTTVIDQIAAEVTVTGGAGSLVRLGIFADSGNLYPGQLVLDAGTILGNSVSVQALAASLVLLPGLYWLAALSTVGAPSMRGSSTRLVNFPVNTGVNFSPTTLVACYVGTPVATAAFEPRFPVSSFTTDTNMPIIGVRVP